MPVSIPDGTLLHTKGLGIAPLSSCFFRGKSWGVEPGNEARVAGEWSLGTRLGQLGSGAWERG